MSKLKVGTNNAFLDEIQSVSLDSNFGHNLNDRLNKIDDNFKKLISIPFLKGQHGENMQLLNLPLLENGNLTNLGKKVVKAIYESEPSTFSPTLDDPYGGTVNNTNSYDRLVEMNPYIAFYGYVERDTQEEKIILSAQQVFIFMDARINYIEEISSDQLTTFEDLSCALTITGELKVDIDTGEGLINDSGTTFNVVKHNIIPTLYYDGDNGINEWCWKINGEKSKISAQGLKGEDGIDAVCAVCAGTKVNVGSSPYEVRITEVLTSTNNQQNVADLREGQLVLVWFADSGKLNCTFGNVEGTTDKKIYVGQTTLNSGYMNCDLLTAFSNFDLRTCMDNICNTENTQDVNVSNLACRGIWVPDQFVSNPTNNSGTFPSLGGNVHMFWSNNDGMTVAHIGLVAYDDTAGNAFNGIEPQQKATKDNTDNSKLKFHYDTLEKDFIEAGRTTEIESYGKTSTKINEVTSPSGLRILSDYAQQGSQNIDQYIKIKANANDDKTVSINSNGVYLIGKTGNKVYDIEIDSEKVVMKSEVTIGQSNIIITGDDNAPSSLLCPLTVQACRENLMNDRKILINKENIILTNGSLVVGVEKGAQRFNAYVQHHANSSIYNFDYGYIFSTLAGYGNNFYWSNSRPRNLSFVPVSIGGYLSLYNSRSNYEGYITDMSEPLKITSDENFKHTFLSGKFGWTGTIIEEGLDSLNNITNEIQIGAIKQFKRIVYPTGENTNLNKYGVATSVSGLWTKIGNVVDVKGKIFFTGVKVEFEKNEETGKYEAGIKSQFPLTYSSLYDFITENISHIKFPLPIVLKDGSSQYVSTGNIFSKPTGIVPTSVVGNQADVQYNGSTASIINTVQSFYNDPNDILNGNATFHFYGNMKNSVIENNLTDIKIHDTGTEFYQSTGHAVIGNLSSIEALPNVFSCIANLKIKGKDHWTFSAIPVPEIIDADMKEPKTGSMHSRFGNSVGPFRFSNGEEADSDHCSLQHMYKIIRPVIPGLENTSSENKKDDDTNNGVMTLHHKYENGTNLKQNTVIASRKLYAATSIAPYLVRYVTFQFSYLLDDDVYGATKASNRNGVTQDYDTEDWNVSSGTIKVLDKKTATKLPDVHYVTEFNNITVGGNTGGNTGTNTSENTGSSTSNPTDDHKPTTNTDDNTSGSTSNPTDDHKPTTNSFSYQQSSDIIQETTNTVIGIYTAYNRILVKKSNSNIVPVISGYNITSDNVNLPNTQTYVWILCKMVNSNINSAKPFAKESDARAYRDELLAQYPGIDFRIAAVDFDTETTIS